MTKSFTIPTLDGDEELELEPGTQPGEILTLRGRGMPVLFIYIGLVVLMIRRMR